jgi:Domain of unknown function (DUF4045)
MKPSAHNSTPRPLPSSPNRSPTLPSTKAAALSRSGTLSWQQRPSSRDSNTPRSRPISRHTHEGASEAADTTDDGHPSEQIALLLSSKDPSWFRQTADRGANSSAYRKIREQPDVNIEETSRPLPGMSRNANVDPEKALYSSSSRDRSTSPSQASSAPDTGSGGNRFSSMSSQSTLGGPNSPLPTKSSQRFGPPTEGHDADQPGARRIGISSLQGQLSRDRPTSPTKGLGGFVQSAMMKRSDSVNKRWSAQAAPGLSRGNSVASYRGGHGYSVLIASGPASPPRETNSASRGPPSSPPAKSRPTSSHSTTTVLHHAEPTNHSSLPPISSNEAISINSTTKFAKESPSCVRAPKEPVSERKSPVLQPVEGLPVSPSKTMDPKRWSPTKASWLESALARPDSPKFTSPKPQTPSWMADLQKSKLSQEDFEPVKSPASSFTLVSPVGLIRSPPPGGHARPLGIGGLPENASSGLTKKVALGEPRNAILEESRPAQPQLSTKGDVPSASPTAHILSLPEPAEGKGGSESLEKGSPEPATALDRKKQPPSSKTKPQTPPKTDFRANLRPPQNFSEESSLKEPEFKNVFGKLKRTETKNYVAPDELKGNILRGKAALNLTGGPQKPNRVDEFKESILKKKESMKAGAGLSQRSATEDSRGDAAPLKSAPLPEALAKRDALTKRTDSAKASSADPEPRPIIGALRSAPPKAEEGRTPAPKDQSPPTYETEHTPAVGSRMDIDIQPSKSEQHGTRKSEGKALQNSAEDVRATKPRALVGSPVSLARSPSTFPETITESKDNKSTGNLVGRLNPGLASILSRGPTSATSSRNASSDDVSFTKIVKPSSAIEDPDGPPASQLTHMTKARARGPKRRLPEAAAPSDQPKDLPTKRNETDMSEEAPQKAQSVPPRKHAVSNDIANPGVRQDAGIAPRVLANLINQNDKVGQQSANNKNPKPRNPVGQRAQEKEVVRLSNTETKEKTKPIVGPKSPTLRKVSSPPPRTSVAMLTNPDQKATVSQEPRSTPIQPNSPTSKDKVAETVGGISPPKDIKQRINSASMNSSLVSTSAGGLRQDFHYSRPDNESKGTSASSQKPTLSGLGLKLDGGKNQAPASQLTPPAEEKPTEGWKSWKYSAQGHGKDTSKTTDQVGPPNNGPNIADLLATFFDENPKMTEGAEIDAQAILLSRPEVNSKNKALKTQAWQINAEGKKEDLPPHQEHILFEDCMYLFVHSCEKGTGSTAVEVYLWSGDGVSEAAIEDAQLFGRKEARDNNTKLEMLRQGKEPAKFFQALGGIVITRRSRNSALYMLCGRRHLGHIAFDEVDLNAASLCSGFPYIISAKFGKLYLWKGKGSGADEVGCARLIGMDLGLTGEIEEVDEGREPPSFFDSLGVSDTPQSFSQQWSLRSTYDHYKCRLFRIEMEQNKGLSGFWTRRGSSPAKASRANAKEVQLFCQRDLDSHCIYVLDAYFNIFV